MTAPILVTGASGYLGRRVLKAAAQAGVPVVATRHSRALPATVSSRRCDLTRAEEVAALLEETRPRAVLHLAGSDRGPLEVIPALAEALAAGCARLDIPLILASTDVVFAGDAAPYGEGAAPRPLGAYGAAKARAEAIVASSRGPTLIARTSLIYDLDEPDHGTAWMAAALARGEALTLFEDQLRQPIWAPELAAALLAAARRQLTGVLHLVGAEVIARAELARRLLDWFEVEGRERARSGSCDPQRHPRDLRLSDEASRRRLGAKLRGVSTVFSEEGRRG